ncbi:serine/arginine repetitive matrix protein 1-like isoform X2 [Amphibalanus amphitrite]|uniref:serine/arginine repetitive matrix protein 1-like isoform X2 n=1 Tax=Amphibalanus amphitrite TaxID=1232801 RepID=UPI001C8FBCD4|nr:serine/arginine repetitive matrix protein 1-like isoform X2 [Amphibalanus amphitrite]
MLACWRFWTPGSRGVGGPPPSDAAAASSTSEQTPPQELSPPSLAGELLPCITCNRTFLPEALARHQNICQKTAHKKRNVFSSSRQRLQGTGIDPEDVHRSPSPPLRRRSGSRSSWRDKHTQLLNTVRSARGAAPAAAAPAVPPDYEQCPFCARHFGPKAAERHISWCKDQKSRINTSAASAVAKNRLDARVKYQAPLPLKPRPKRLSVERLSRETSPAVSVVSSAPSATPSSLSTARSPTRPTRDYAREYRERASQEREQRIQERKRSPASVVSSGYGKQPASRLAREGSEPRATSPTKEAFRRTQSFRARPAGTRATNLKHQRTVNTFSPTSVRSAGSAKQHQSYLQHHQQQHQQRDEPDGGEDTPADRPGYQRSTSTPAESGGGPDHLHHHHDHHTRLSPSRQSHAFSTAPERSPSPPPPPPPPDAGQEAYITRSQLDEYQRISDAVKQDADYDPYEKAERQLEELLGHASSPSPPAKPAAARLTTNRSPSPLRAPHSPSPARPAAPLSPQSSESAPAPARSPSPGRSAFAKIERPHSALFPLRGDVLKPTALSPRKDPIAEAISILNDYAIQQRSAADEGPPSPPSSVESSQTVINRYDFVSSAIASYRENAASMPPPPEPEPESPGSPTNTSPPTNHGSRRLGAAQPSQGSVETPPPADGAASPPSQQQQPGWSEPLWRPIDDCALSSNRSSVERNGGGLHHLQFPGLSLGGDERGMSPSDSLYETEMPDFDLIMEQARIASERKHNALSPRKARMRGLDMREMMGIEVSDLNMKNGGGGGGGGGATSPRFCHECGSQYPVQAAKFCCQCGAQKLCI